DADAIEQAMQTVLRQAFRPEFLNRIDDIITFKPLGLAELDKIVEIQLRDVYKRLEQMRIDLQVSDCAKEILALQGLDPVYGARPLKRLIQRQVVDRVAGLIIDGKVGQNQTIYLDSDENNEFVVQVKDGRASVEQEVDMADEQEALEPDAVE
ncbi:MAG: ATP-dependent chaperone ClpB, partial [Coriobacteriia bacterium]|nr:ATP-dependent chaperone ClpB [Coriobacteriia bacterium]